MSAALAIPGTVQLVDLQGLLNVKHGKSHQDIILIPQPSDHPDDPLRWAQPRKMQNIVCAMGWCFFAAAMISGLSPAYVLIEKSTGISVADLSTGNGLMYLFLGWGTLVTQCLALNYGRRPVLLASIIAASAVTLWSAYLKTRGEFFANRIILGAVSSPMETLIEVIIGDLFFTHDRGFCMGMYCWMLWCGAFLAPVASGYIAEALGWRWIQYVMTCIGTAIAIITFFFLEETMFYRPQSFDQVQAISGRREESNEKAPGSVEASDGNEIRKDIGPAGSGQSMISVSKGVESSELTSLPRSTTTYAEKLKLWGFRHPQQPNTFKFFFLPFQLLRYSGMLFAGVLVGGILSWYNVVGGSLALILSSEPYNFTTNSVGLTYLSSVIGVTVGCFLSGWMTDILTVYLARRNDGIMEPEQRLWMCLVAILLHPAGCLCLVLERPIRSTGLAFTYILDSYKEVAGEGLVSAILVRNLMGFAFRYAVVPMINSLGLRYAFVLVALLGLGLWLICIFMIYFGKSFRRSTATRYWNQVEKYGAVVH